MNLSVIVPVLNEEREIAGCLGAIRAEFDGEILVVDGGSEDETRARAEASGANVLIGPRGMAAQCNLGARSAQGDLLFFVAADSRPAPGWREAIEAAMGSPYVAGGGLRLSLDDPAFAYRVIAWGGNFRSRYLGIALADQGLFVRREIFESLGGMAGDSLIPHARLCRQMKRYGEVLLLPLPMRSSAREWRKQGAVRTVIRHVLIYLRFKYREL